MYTLNREMIDEMDRWRDLGLHIDFDPSENRGVTEEDLSELYEQLDIEQE